MEYKFIVVEVKINAIVIQSAATGTYVELKQKEIGKFYKVGDLI